MPLATGDHMMSHPMRRAAAAVFCAFCFSRGSKTGLDVSVGGPPESPTCPDSAQNIYVLAGGSSADTRGLVMRFDPSNAAFGPALDVRCLLPLHLATGLAVDRMGSLYVADDSIDRHLLLRMNPKTATCQPTPFALDLGALSIAFTADGAGGSDRLYLTKDGNLTRLDTSTWMATSVAPYTGVGSDAVTFLTGTSQGELFTVYPFPWSRIPDRCQPLGSDWLTPSCAASAFPKLIIGQVDPDSASVTDRWSLQFGTPSSGQVALAGAPLSVQAFVFWGGDFYLFIGRDVWQFRPSDRSISQIAHTDDLVVAAGASTCAPSL